MGCYDIRCCISGIKMRHGTPIVLVPIIIGVISGVGWAVIVGPKNHMIPLLSKKSQCSAQTSRYNCRIKRTGQIINTK